jgi:dihydroorotate dehydrogenase
MSNPLYHKFLKPLLFKTSPETAHSITMNGLTMVNNVPLVNRIWKNTWTPKEHKPVELFGLNFKNPVGLAAGFDKDGKYIKQMASLGFGYLEIGTVTPKPQSGNPKPRLFRLPADRALINRMGFNNDGVDALVSRLSRLKNRPCIIGGNIGKNKITPNEKAVDDYLICFHKLHDYVDYFTVNVSSPNTPGLRELQDKEPLLKILSALTAENNKKERQKPILLKIAPDLTDGQVEDIGDIYKLSGIAGLIVSNTTISRKGLITPEQRVEEMGAGGLSGAPLLNRATQLIRTINEHSPELPIIGVGGIVKPEDAILLKDAGAKLVQVYTGMIYAGPGLIKDIVHSW